MSGDLECVIFQVLDQSPDFGTLGQEGPSYISTRWLFAESIWCMHLDLIQQCQCHPGVSMLMKPSPLPQAVDFKAHLLFRSLYSPDFLRLSLCLGPGFVALAALFTSFLCLCRPNCRWRRRACNRGENRTHHYAGLNMYLSRSVIQVQRPHV